MCNWALSGDGDLITSSTIFICVLISLHDTNLPEQVIMGVGFVREQVGIMIGYAETVTM